MRIRTTLILLATFIGLLGVYAVLEWTEQPTAEELRRRQFQVLPRLFDTKAEDVTRLEIAYRRPAGGAETVVLEWTAEGTWQMRQPVETPASAGRVKHLIDDLTNMTRKERTTVYRGTDGEPLSLAQFGLAEPALVVTVTTLDDRTARLAVGSATPANPDTFFVQDLDESPAAVQVVDGRSLSGFRTQGAVGFRQRRLVPASVPDINDLFVRDAEGGLVLSAEKKGVTWHFSLPVQDRGDTAAIRAKLLEPLVSLHVRDDADFINDHPTPEQLASYGLDRPQLTFRLGWQERVGETVRPRTVEVRIGKPLPGDATKLHAMWVGRNNVVAVDAGIRTHVDRLKFGDLRDRTAVRIDPNRVDRIRIAPAEGTPIVLVRSREETVDYRMGRVIESAWRIVEPVRMRADRDTVKAFIRAVAELRVKTFLDDGSFAAHGLEPARVTVTLREGRHLMAEAGAPDGAEPKTTTVAFGSVDPNRRRRYLKRTPEARPILVVRDSDELALGLAGRLLDLRHRQMLALDPERVSRIQVERDGHRFLAERVTDADGNTTWAMASPAAAPADRAVAYRLARQIAGLRAAKFVSDDMTLVRRYGLTDAAPVRATVTLEKKQDEPASTHVILIGRAVQPGRKKSNVYARLKGQDLIFELDYMAYLDFIEELYDRQLARFERADIEKVAVRWPNARLEATHEDDLFEAADPARWPGFSPKRFGEFIDLLAELQAERFVRYTGSAEATWQLTAGRERMVVTLSLRGGRTLTLRFGAEADDGLRYAAVEGFAPIALVKDEGLREVVEQGPSHFRQTAAATAPSVN